MNPQNAGAGLGAGGRPGQQPPVCEGLHLVITLMWAFCMMKPPVILI